jgi:hypothetical protein
MTLDVATAARLEAEQDCYRMLEGRFRRALRCLGVMPDSIERIVADEEIESDYLTKRDFDNLEIINRASDAESKLEPLRVALAEARERIAELEALRCHCQTRLNDGQMGLSLGADGGKVPT